MGTTNLIKLFKVKKESALAVSVRCNPIFAKNGRLGISLIPGFVLNCYVIVMNTGTVYVMLMIVMYR